MSSIWWNISLALPLITNYCKDVQILFSLFSVVVMDTSMAKSVLINEDLRVANNIKSNRPRRGPTGALTSIGTGRARPYQVPPPSPGQHKQFSWRPQYKIRIRAAENPKPFEEPPSASHLKREIHSITISISISIPLHSHSILLVIIDLIAIDGIIRLFGIVIKNSFTMFMIVDLIMSE